MLLPYFKKDITEAGCDEVGRGCLAGPVVAAAVIFPQGYINKELNDSKKLSKLQRLRLRDEIIKNAKDYAIGSCDPDEIDRINILNATFAAMHEAIRNLNNVPEHLIIDGNRFKPFENVPFQCIVKGDSKYMSIAAASILAKTYRDEYMAELSLTYPEYGWEKNAGYPTRAHRLAIINFGVSPLHRKSFRLIDNQLRLFVENIRNKKRG